MSVAAYDGMAAIYEVARRLNGAIDADKALAILKGLSLTSPRGPITIDPRPAMWCRRCTSAGSRR